MKILLLIAAFVCLVTLACESESGRSISSTTDARSGAIPTCNDPCYSFDSTVEAAFAETHPPTPVPTLNPDQAAYAVALATAQEAASISAEQTFEARPTSTPIPPPYQLALLSSSCTNDEGFVTCEGSVRNIGTTILQDIEAVVEWSDQQRDGVTKASDDAIIEFNPLLPGQDSPWKVYSTNHNPVLKWFHVTFKTLFGELILTRNDAAQ